MARQFDGSTQAMVTSANVDLTSAAAGPITLAFWLWVNAFGNTDALALEHSANYNSNGGSFIVNPNDSGTSEFDFGMEAGGAYTKAHFPRPSGAAWHHYMLIIANAGASLAAYLDGSSQAITVNFSAASGAWQSYLLTAMARNGGAALLLAGRMAGLGIWSGALTSGNAATLAGGAAPSTVGTPLYAWNLCGAASPEPASNGTPTMTLVSAPPQVADPTSFAAVCGGATVPTYPQLERGIRGLARGVSGGIARSFVRKDRLFVPSYARQGAA